MDKKKLLLIGGGLTLLIAIILIISLIMPKEQPISRGGGITSVILAKGEDKNKNPTSITDLFSTNDPEIHAIITFANLSANQNITYQWVDTGSGKILKEEKRQNQAIFSGLSSASLIKDDRLIWGAGNYEFRILLNDQLKIKKSYSVKTEIDIQQEKILSSIQSIVLTTAVDLRGNPIRNISSVFSKDDENIFASIIYQNMPVKAEFEGRWIFLDQERLIKTYQKSIIGTDIFAFGMNAKTDSWVPIKKWVAGKYELRVYLNGEQIKIISFIVE